VKASIDPVVIWGGIHAQTRPQDCIQHADVVCLSEGEYVLASADRTCSGSTSRTRTGTRWRVRI